MNVCIVDEFMADTASVEDMDIAPPHSMSSASEHDQGGPNDDHHNNSSFSSLANNNNNHIRSAIHPENDWFFSQVKGSADPQVTDGQSQFILINMSYKVSFAFF